MYVDKNHLEICPSFWSSQTSSGGGGGRGERPWKSESEQFLQQSCPDIAFNDEETVTIFPSFFSSNYYSNISPRNLFQSSEAARGGVGG